MTPEKREEIAKLAAEVCDKEVRYRVLAQMNMPKDAEEAKKARIELTLARAEYYEACNRLEDAMPPKPKVLLGWGGAAVLGASGGAYHGSGSGGSTGTTPGLGAAGGAGGYLGGGGCGGAFPLPTNIKQR